ncbi:Small-conductance mechanosensitive channel [Methanimicrococcus stummii]|uniref:Small-conductance mechanosensitive channel n=1 Tax=Methanimicrococcus stummii TaxID=3028294 RepID=A0AA96V7Z8_9EURY|nr:mechanosensitive ion channel family protein [Methanimicrococcus sp. Es2]WNY28404.1 Small-conductance mechanosensitive channel [Methanimicrococcus sp. Es2]
MAFLIDLNLWERFHDNVEAMIENFVEYLPEIVFALIIFILTFIVAQFIDKKITKYSARLQKRMRVGPTKFVMLRHVIIGLVYLIGLVLIFYTIPPLQKLSTAILASVGVLGIIFGIAAQDSFGNLISGIALVFFQPFRIGDLITVGSNYGRVTDINLRQTTIKTSDDRIILIPNSVLNKETVINWTYDDTVVRWSFTIQISYESDIDRARAIMIEEARKNSYVLSKEVLARQKPGTSEDVRARVSDLASFGVNILLDFWVNDRDNAYSAEYAIRENIKKRFDSEPNVSIPLPQYVLSTGAPLGVQLTDANAAEKSDVNGNLNDETVV